MRFVSGYKPMHKCMHPKCSLQPPSRIVMTYVFLKMFYGGVYLENHKFPWERALFLGISLEKHKFLDLNTMST